MTPIKELLTEEFVENSTIESNRLYGQAMFEREGVEIVEQNDFGVEAKVGGLDGSVKNGGGSKRRVTFSMQNDELNWECSCNSKNHQIFCKHCVALALVIQSERLD